MDAPTYSGQSEDDFETPPVTYLVKGPEDDRILKLKPHQMTSTTLARIFRLEPDSIILYGSDDSVIVPTTSGGTSKLSSFLTWKVIFQKLSHNYQKFTDNSRHCNSNNS